MPVSFKLFFQYTIRPGRAGRVSNQAAAGGLGAGQGGKMNQSEEREIAELRDRLSRLTEASLRINESLDFDTVLQGVLDSARSLTEARSSVITLLDDSGRIADFLSSGMTAEAAGLLWEMPDGMRLFEYLGSAREPLRLRDLLGHVRSLGLPEFRPPVAVGPVVPFMAAPVIHRGELAGHLYVAEKEGGRGSVCLRSTSLESPYDYWGRYTQSKRNPRFVYRLQLRSKPVLNPHGKPSPDGSG